MKLCLKSDPRLTTAVPRTAFQPLYGQLANVFGRRYPLIFATALFTFGSGICGGASNIGMMVAGRALQGVGGMSFLYLCSNWCLTNTTPCAWTSPGRDNADGPHAFAAGGVNVLIEIVVCDLVPLRERGNYLAIIFGLIALGTALGPVVRIVINLELYDSSC